MKKNAGSNHTDVAPIKDIAGYKVVEKIGETFNSLVYRAYNEDASKYFILKTLPNDLPSSAETARLKREYDLIQRMDIDGILKVHDVLHVDEGVTLVMEDFRGISIKEILHEGFPLEQFLELAIRISKILGKLHQENISHRDINPGNILLNKARDILKITGFGIDAEYTGRNKKIYNSDVIEDTLLYISPEQTGRMNHAVDYRTDLYSLGIVFYEMLTGDVPFRSNDAMVIIHSHIAKEPVPARRINPAIPEPLSDIVMKLLSKDASERYQNGLGLAADLRTCLEQMRSRGRVEPFGLGALDISLRFNIPQNVVGREKELEQLCQAFDRVVSGTVEVVMVTGEPGIGKSALIHEVHKSIVRQCGYFISGKFNQFQRVVPFSGIIQAFQSLIKLLLTENDQRIKEWENRFLSALGANAKIITDVIPEMEFIIGRQPEVPELGAEENRNRFYLVFKNFVRSLANQAHPLVIFLDDLQWADSASLTLIKSIITDPHLDHVLFFGAYRDTEVGSHHPLLLTCDAIQAKGRPLSIIHLTELKPGDICTLLISFQNNAVIDLRDLAQAIHDKTNGSPFFVNQFLKMLYDKRHLTLDPVKGWQWDIEKIRELQVTENVVEFITVKIHHLAKAPLSIIRVCACIGNRFDLETIAAITRRPIDEILCAIDTLIQESLIHRKGDLYRFHHDRIHEAAYSLLPEVEREDLHFRIGMHFFDKTPSDKIANRIFYITDHLNRGRRRMKNREDRTFLSDLNLKAGIKAKEASAYLAAVDYLFIGIGLLPEDAWQSEYDLSYALYMQQMECLYLNRNFDAAEKIFNIIISHAVSKKDKAMANKTMLTLYTNMRTPKDAIDLGLKALSLCGIHLSPNEGKISVVTELMQTLWLLKKNSPDKIFDLPPMEDEEMIASLQLMFTLGTPAYYYNKNLFAKLTLKGINIGLRHGHIPPCCAGAVVAQATIIQTVLGNYKLGYQLGEIALKLNENTDSRKTAGMVHHAFAFFLQHWKGDARKNIDIFQKAYELSLDAGDFIYAGHAINARADCSIMIGVGLDDILENNKKYTDFMNVVKDPFIGRRFRENNQYILNLKGKTDNRFALSGSGFDEEENIKQLREEKNTFGLCYSLHYKMRLLYLYGKYEEAHQLAKEIGRHINDQVGTLIVPEYYFYYSLILTALMLDGSVKKRFCRITLKRNRHKMKKWAKLCKANFQHKYHLVTAETMAIKNRFRVAHNLYRKAIKGAQQNKYLNEEAIACERLSLFYLRGSARQEAMLYMQQACRCYESWGACAKVLDIRERYPELLQVAEKPKVASNGEWAGITSQTIDLSVVIRVSQIISREIRLDRLLTKIMHLSLTNAGAERAFLILESEGELIIEASEDVRTNSVKVMQSVPLKECSQLCQAIVNFVNNSGKDVILDDAVRKGPFRNDPYIINNRCKSVLCTPIMSKGTLTAILYMENNLSVDAFTPQRTNILRLISTQAAFSIENSRLFELATTDGLTRLYVNRYFQLFFDNELHRSSRHKNHFSVIMMDIDDFKSLNDTYGHQMGDKVLKTLAGAIKKICRNEDVLARYGGEEFVMLLPETTSQQALVVAEKVRACVARLEIPHGNGTIQVTVSLGVSQYPRHGEDKESLIHCADTALYTSKHRGKNRVTLYDKNDMAEKIENDQTRIQPEPCRKHGYNRKRAAAIELFPNIDFL